MEVQSLLKLQMEDNQRRKAEAKRKKDEEERAEMQRIEKELKLQADAFEAEKKAKVKDAAAKQQQLEFDLRVKQEEELKKTNPKLRHKTMHDDAVPLAPVLIQLPPSVLPPESQGPPIMPPAQRSRHASSPDKPTTEPPHVKPIPRHKTPLTKPNKPPFEVVNLLEGSLDGPSSFIASKNDHATTFKCESTMIYFDGQVDTQQCPAMQPHQLEASPSHMSTLSPRFSSLFAGTNEASLIHTPGDPLNKSLPTAPSAVVEPSTLVASTHPKPSFHVHVVAPPSSWHTLRYGCDESFSRTTGWDGSFDVDTLFEKNTTRRTLLEVRWVDDLLVVSEETVRSN
ncbi:hypothetical protein DYB32_003900 [Aphanomyces invadans]|uniref:Uncharacterized protein n=1 Tax=Aphanomyces invadans TaxID=157072 RepID=A0A3R6WN83_9STRA|nr:hypothetical protein DYB32_003900 [Aphanomyces invadans]